MRNRIRFVHLALVAIILSVSGCGPAAEEATPTLSVAAATSVPTLAPPTSIELASPTFTSPLPTATAPLPTSTAPATLTSEAPTPTQEVPTPTAEVPSLAPTPTLTESPSATPTSAAVGGAPPTLEGLAIELSPVLGGLATPVGIANAGDGSGRLFVLEKVGRIRIVRAGALVTEPFLDLTGRVGSQSNEQGLLGLAFHPQYAQRGTFFVNYTDRQGNTVVSRFSVTSDPDRADPASEAVVLRVNQPASNHNGGHLAFGRDGALYVGLGDGGGAGDRYGNGQNGQTLLGAMLRLNVDGEQPYAIPADNPFVGNPTVRDEIWAVGLRNPWRFSFDRRTGDLYLADVGQNMYEEINLQPVSDPGGHNYGWPIMEGLHCFPADQTCDRQGLTLPVQEYDHMQGCSVTGGYVYRGQAYPSLDGIYLFGDYCSGRIWGMARMGATGDWRVAQLAQADIRLSSFGEDEAGELYLLDMAGGRLFRITARSR